MKTFFYYVLMAVHLSPLIISYLFLIREALKIVKRLKNKANAIKEKMEAQDGIH